MSNNTPDYEDNLAFEPAKANGTLATIARDGKAVAIRCYIDSQHYFDLGLEDAPKKMDWSAAKIWCEENYSRLPTAQELQFIGRNLKNINKMLKSAGGKEMKKGWYWSADEYSNKSAWLSRINLHGLIKYSLKINNLYVRAIMICD
nr:MAG: protein of unknown function DUF823 [Bacteriophage sp.]